MFVESGQPFEAVYASGMAGLIPGIEVAIFDGDGNVVEGPTGTNITEELIGLTPTGVYTWNVPAAPLATGQYSIVWSPDGSQILVVASHETISHHSALNPLVNPLPASLFLVDVDDSDVRTIATGHYVAAAWSPDGSRIAAIDYPGERNVVVLRADGSGEPLPLAELPGDDLFTGVVWNPAPPR